MEKNSNDSNSMLLRVDRDDDGKIIGWEITMKSEDAEIIFEDIIKDLKNEGRQLSAEQYEKLLHEITHAKNKNQPKRNARK